MACEMIGTTRDKIIGAVCHKFICPADVGACPITDRGGVVDHAERILLTWTAWSSNWSRVSSSVLAAA
jgi:hypothetical protein